MPLPLLLRGAKHPYKTEVLKLLYLMEERMVQMYHVPFWGIPYFVWRLGPVSVDVFEELSDGPQLLEDYITLEPDGMGVKVIAKKAFEDDEFSNTELQVMEQVMEKFGQLTSTELIAETHRRAVCGGLQQRNPDCWTILNRRELTVRILL